MWTRRLIATCLMAGFSLGAAGAANIPRRSPEFAINTSTGKQVLLSQYKGKVIVLLFILTYCPHCQKTIGMLNQMQPQFGPRGFQVLSSAIEDTAAANLSDFLRRFNPPFPVGFNDRSAVLDYLQHPVMNRLLMPQLVFIDKNFTIRAQYTGDDKFFGDDQEKNLRAQIEALLKENGSAAKKSATAAGRKKGAT